MTATIPYEWLKQIPTAILQLDEIPLFGHAPPFPWKELSKGMSEIFQIPDFQIIPDPFQWRTAEDLYTGMGDNIVPLVCTIPSLEGNLYWIMTARDIHRLMSLLLNDDHSEYDILEDDFLQGFYHFTAYEVIYLLSKLSFGSSLSPEIQKIESLPSNASLCADIKIHLRGKVLTGRILISPELRRTWKERHAERSLEVPLHTSLAEKLTLSIHAEVGRTSIKRSEWKTVRPGDFIVLDNCTVKSSDEKGGTVTLTLNERPFFIGKIKDGNIKILDHPIYYQEEEITMSHPPENSEEHDDSSMDFDSESDFDSELESEHEKEEESELEEESHEDSHLSEEEEHETDEHEHETDEHETEEHEEHKEESDTLSETKASPAIHIEDIPLSIIIEVGRLQMPVKKILELQPGNLLELDVHPENGVDLVVNGKRIAKGELIKLGETLGVRILDIS